MLYRDTQQLNEAEYFFTESCKVIEACFGKEHPDTAQAYRNLAGISQMKGNLDESLGYYNKALRIYRDTYKGNHPEISVTLNDKAILQMREGNHGSAIRTLQEALAMNLALFKEVSHLEVKRLLVNLLAAYEHVPKDEFYATYVDMMSTANRNSS